MVLTLLIIGLGSYGIVARVITQELLDNDPERISSFQARFLGHVFPGETLRILLWKKENKYIFKAEVIERNTKALVGSFEEKARPKL